MGFVLKIVTYLLQARTVEPEKQPLLVNGSGTNLFLGNNSKQMGACGNSPRAAAEILLEMVFSTVVLEVL
jgi:hypothetical protein